MDKDTEDHEDQVAAEETVPDYGEMAGSHLHEEDCDRPIPVVADTQPPSMVLHTAVVVLDTSVVACCFDDRLDTCLGAIR